MENPGFEGGHYNQDGIPEITVPNGWRMHWSNNELIFGGEWPTARPETVVWNSTGGIPEGEELYWRDGIYTMKVFKSWTPMWAAMSQDVENLEVGRKYRLVVPIYVDIFEDYADGKKVIPFRKDSGKVRLGAGPVGAAWRDENAIKYSGWWTAETIDPFYQAMPTFVYDFVATQPNMTIWIEMASSYPYPNNGFFFDLPGLFATNETGAVQPPPAAPAQGQPAAPAAPVVAQPVATIVPPTPRADGAIVHVVQPGESLWLIAIQYADTLGMSAEEALPYIQELNDSPAFINPGDELIIQEGTAAAPTAEASAEATAEGTPSAEETAEGSEETAESATPGAESPDEAGGEEVASESSSADERAAAPAGTICVASFQDANADGQRNESEELVANAAIAIARAGTTVSTYITDGASEPYCFELAEADSYQLQLYPPAGYSATTEDNWAVSIADGQSYTVSFGLSETAQTAADSQAGAEEAMTEPDAATTDDEAATEQSDGPFGNLGVVILGVAAVLVLLAVVGVVMLRRG